MTIPHTPRRIARAAFVALAVAAMGACSSSKPSATSATTTAPAAAAATTTAAPTTAAIKAPPDPCTLIDKSVAQQVVGVTLADGTKSGNPDDAMCQYLSPPTGPTAQVEVFVGPGAKKSLDTDKITLQHDFTTLTGIGDEAYLESGNVYLRKGTTWASVNIVALDAPDQQVQDGLKTLATEIAAKL